MRTDRDSYMMDLALRAAEQTTCVRRGVGCVLVDDRGHILAVAYNGVAKGQPHCNHLQPAHWIGEREPFPFACKDSSKEGCEAVHAEQNALLQCSDPWKVSTAYCTRSPCKNCLKLLLNTSCKRVLFVDEHSDPLPREMWLKAGREWSKL